MSALFSPLLAFIQSSIGRKIIVAVTGVALAGFVLGHMVGNLLLFLGPEAINTYGDKLKSTGNLLWVARIGLLVFVGLHIYFTIKLTLENKRARGHEKYAVSSPRKSTLASRTMAISGLILLSFIVYHILHFTLHAGNDYGKLYTTLESSGKRVHDVYTMVIHGFSWWPASLFYIVAMGLLSLHLSHGVSSMFQTLGIATARTWPLFKFIGVAFAVLIFVGNSSIPLAVLLGLVK